MENHIFGRYDMSSKLKALPLAVAQLIAAGAFSAAAVAPAMAQMGVTPIERIDVTGTNIRRTDSETPSEVQVITREQMIQSGYTSVSQVLRDLTANNQGTLSTGFGRAFASGASGVALRGLTVGSTLVLIDGYRMAGYPRSDDAQRSFVNLNSIPFVAVERIEILLDGASAIYGSDAIAGVVNVILKKDFKGTNINATGGTTTKGGGTTWDAQILQGFGDVSQGLGGYVGLEYRSQEAIKLSQRDGEPWNVTDYTPWGGNDLRPGAKNANVANPLLRTPYLQRTSGSANSASTFAFYPGCDFDKRNANQCLYENNWGDVQPRSQNVNLIGNVTWRISNDWSLNFNAAYFDSQVTAHTNPGAVPFGSFAGNTTGGPNLLPVVGVNAIPAFTVPANYPGNPFGAPANIRAILPDVTGRSTAVDSASTRFVAQLTGSSWGWDFVGAAGYTNVRSSITWDGYINIPFLYRALNDPVNPYLLTGGNSQELQNKVSGQVNTVNWNNLSFIQGSGSRDLMQLQGGPLSIAIGVGDVYRNLQAPNPGAQQDGLVGTPGGATYAVGSQNNANAYVEVAAPVLKSLEIDGALRYDYYNVPNNSTWNPKIGAKWTPIKEFALRGTAGTGFRAPFITEAGNAGAVFSAPTQRDPLLCPVTNANGTGNLTSPANVPAFCSFSPAFLQGSNPNLKPEKSDNYTVGVILEPIKGWSSTIDWYYIKLKNQIIPSSQLADFNGIVVRGAPQIVTFGDGSTGLSSVGTIQYIATPFVNAQQTSTSGFDLSSGYTWTLPDNSKLLTSVTWNHILSYELTAGGVKSKLEGTHGPTLIGGDTGTPKDRAQATIQWAKGPFTMTTTVNYVGRFNVTDPSSPDAQTCADSLNNNNGIRWANTGVPPNYCNVASFTYVNMNFLYALNKQWTLQASIQNAFNAKPPNDFETYGGINASQPNAGNQSTFLNPSLHQIGAVGPFWSLGFIYSFDPTPAPAPPAAPAPAAAPVVQPPPPPPPPAPTPPPAPQVQRITLDSKALFDFDKADLKPEGKAAIDSQIVGKISQVQKLEVVLVTGHTDRIGSVAYNQKLSERRANTVRDYLVSKGVDKAKIETIGMGEKQPVVQCDQKEVKALIACLQPNRRVEVQVKGEAKK
jgi:iron complex outermembrane recepter protein